MLAQTISTQEISYCYVALSNNYIKKSLALDKTGHSSTPEVILKREGGQVSMHIFLHTLYKLSNNLIYSISGD